MSKRVAILQSSYIPWKGYFDIINMVDEFILFDDVQYTKQDWRNRNRIKTPGGIVWLTIPVLAKGRVTRQQKINETEARDGEWRKRHFDTLRMNYARTPGFVEFRDEIERLYLGSSETSLSAINRSFIEAICGILGIGTKITCSMDYGVIDGKTERLIDLCRKAGADSYLSGPSAEFYIDKSLFAGAGIGLEFMEYDGYPEYDQKYPPFEHKVSVLDLVFCTGNRARNFLLSTGVRRKSG